jgi:hypothetical protein
VKKLAIILLVFALWCSQTSPGRSQEATATHPPEPTSTISPHRAASAPARTEFIIATDGDPFGLRLESGILDFCDKRGKWKLDLETGSQVAGARTCPNNDEPNTACSGLSLDLAVRAPLSEPNDIVDVDGWSVALKGRVHDCAADGDMLAIVTASRVVLVNVANRTSKEVSREGGDRVTIGSGWVAWSRGSKLRVVWREALRKSVFLQTEMRGQSKGRSCSTLT